MIKSLLIELLTLLLAALTNDKSDFLSSQPSSPYSYKPSHIRASDRYFVGYFETWSEKWTDKPEESSLAKLPPYMNAVILAFVQPDCQYAGGLNLAGTGLNFPYDGNTAKGAIAALKTKNPNTKVLLAVGGATYLNWQGLNEKALATLVTDLGADGIDIDYEPANPGCTAANGAVSCATDKEYTDAVTRIRGALPRPAIVTTAGWSIGAYGQGDFQNSKPAGDHTGLAVNMLKQAGDSLDWINVMSYDASNDLDPTEAFKAYKSLFKGKVMLGVEIPPEAWGGHVLTMDEVNKFADFVNGSEGDGMMLWSIQKQGSPSAQDIGKAVCTKFGMDGCDA